MRIAIGCAALCMGRGGTERAAANLAREMTKRGHDVLIISQDWDPRLIEPIYPLEPSVRHMICPTSNGNKANINYLKKFLIAEKPDVFLSMQSDFTHLFWAMACMGSGIPFIVSERNDPVRYTEKIWNRPGRLAVLSGADCIHELLPVHTRSIPEIWHNKVRVISNAAPTFTTFANPAGKMGKRKQILYLARFKEQKRPLLLIQAFHSLIDRYPDWDLTLYGHGPEENALKRYVLRKNMRNRVFFPGLCTDVQTAYANANIYCLPSYIEGFPNTILEAMTAGLPVVAFSDCPSLRDILQRGKTGLLVEESTSKDLADALDKLMGNAELRRNMGESAKIAAAAYAPEHIYDQWEKLFMEMASRKGNTVMDSFYKEPFASMSRLSAAARREYLYRDFGEPMPYSFSGFKQKSGRVFHNLFSKSGSRGRVSSMSTDNKDQ